MKILRKYKYLISLVFLFIFLRLPSLLEPYWYNDEGIYLVLGFAIKKGLILYSQIHDNKPPTLYYLAALGQSVFGFRLLLFVWMIPTIYFFYKLASKFLNTFFSKFSTLIFLIITSIPYIEGNISNAEIFMLLPTILAIYIYLNKKNILSYVFVGLLFGFAFTIKVPVLVELFFVLFFVFITNIKKPLLFIKNNLIIIISFTLPTLLQYIYFLIKGSSANYLYSAIFRNFTYISSWVSSPGVVNLPPFTMTTRIICLLTIFLISTYFFYIKKIKKETLFLVLWFSSCIFASLISSRPYPHYLIQITPVFSILVFYLFINISKFSKLYILFLLLISFFILKKYNFYFYKVFDYYSVSYQYIFHQKSKEDYYKFFDKNIMDTYNISNYIKDNSKESDKIFVWDDLPFVYSLSSRLPVGRYTSAYHIVDFNAYDETMTQLKIELPNFIVYKPIKSYPFNELEDFINLYYYIDNQFGSNIIYRLR